MKFTSNIVLAVLLSTTPIIGYSDTKLRFEKVYHLPFYQNETVISTSIAVLSAGAVAFTVMTAGTGAPAAAAGVGSFASWVGGGGAGSYMVGLSTVGGWVGGNAIVGAAILNGAVAAAGGKFSKIVASKFGRAQMAVNTISTINDLGKVEVKNSLYSTTVVYSEDLGTKNVLDAIKLLRERKITSEQMKSYAKSIIKNNYNRDDIIVASMILHNLGVEDVFSRTIKNIHMKPDEGFGLYLKALAYFVDDESAMATKYIIKSMTAEPEAIEPVILLMMIDDEINNYNKNIQYYEGRLDDFDDGHYKTKNSLVTAYMAMGNLFNARSQYRKALKFHMEAHFEFPLFSGGDEYAQISSAISRDYFNLNDYEKSSKFHKKSLIHVSDETLKKSIISEFKYMWSI